MGYKFLSELNYEEALIAFDKAIEIEPKRDAAYIGKADTYFARGGENMLADIDDSLRVGYERTQSEAIADTYLRIADALMANEQYDLAQELFRKGLEVTGDERLKARIDENGKLVSTVEQTPAGSIEIVEVFPKTVKAGVKTTFSVMVHYTSENVGDCIIYAGVNTGKSNSYSLYDEYILQNTSGNYKFDFTCTPVLWEDHAFGIYVNISEYPHTDSWSPLASDRYDLTMIE